MPMAGHLPPLSPLQTCFTPPTHPSSPVGSSPASYTGFLPEEAEPDVLGGLETGFPFDVQPENGAPGEMAELIRLHLAAFTEHGIGSELESL